MGILDGQGERNSDHFQPSEEMGCPSPNVLILALTTDKPTSLSNDIRGSIDSPSPEEYTDGDNWHEVPGK